MTAIQQEMETTLDALLPSADHEPRALNQAMRYATLGGGKRVRACSPTPLASWVRPRPALARRRRWR